MTGKDEQGDRLKALERFVEEGTPIFHEGERGTDLFILMEGEVEVLIDGRRVATVNEPGSYLGEMSSLLDAPRSATVRTLRASRFIVVPHNKVEGFLKHTPEMGFKLSQVLAERLRATSDHVSRLEKQAEKARQLLRDLLAEVERRAGESAPVRDLLDEFKRRLRQQKKEATQQRLANPTLDVPTMRRKKAAPAGDVPTGSEPGVPAVAAGTAEKPSVLERALECYFHPMQESFTGYQLVANSHIVDVNPFDVTVYQSAAPGRHFVNYIAREVHVCPVCLFAANDFNYYKIKERPAAEPPRELSQKAIDHFMETKSARRELASAYWKRLVQVERDPEAGMISQRLAALCMGQLQQIHKDAFPLLRMRQGNHLLKAAQLAVELDRPDEELSLLEQALPVLAEAYEKVEGANLYKVIYQVMSLSIHLGDEHQAAKLVAALRKLKESPKVPEAERNFLNAYASRAEKVWQDREALTREQILKDRAHGVSGRGVAAVG